MKDYQPISCTFYDFIEHFATLRKEIIIQYKETDVSITSLTSIILDTQSNKDGEFMIIKDLKHPIRLDKIISLDGKFLSDYQFC